MSKQTKTIKQEEPNEAKAKKLMNERQPVDEYINKVTQKIIDLQSDLFKVSGYTMPILSRTLLVFDRCPIIDAIYLVVSPVQRMVCQREILDPLRLSTHVTVVAGGDSRQASVYNGLVAMDSGNHWVGIHDGVRPFIRSDQIESCFKTARASGACILGLPSAETLKEVDPRGTIRQTRQREGIWMAQTPQVFKLAEILEAHRDALANAFLTTDDAALMERLGRPVKMMAGSRQNMKITTRDDLILAEAMVAAGLHEMKKQVD